MRSKQYGALLILSVLLYVQELQQEKADFVVVVESFFNGTFEAKNVDRNRLLVRVLNSIIMPCRILM